MDDKLRTLGEPVYTPEELATAYKLHPATIRRKFVDEPGTIRFGAPCSHNQRQRFVLRIPESVVRRVLGRLAVSA